MEEYNNISKEELISEIERLRIENTNLRNYIRLYISVLSSIRDITKKYAPEISEWMSNHNSSIS